MKGAIIVPTFYKKRHKRGIKSQRSKFLFERISQQYKFPVLYTDAPDLSGLDVAVIYAVPYHNRPGIPPGLLNTKVKLIGYFEDLQCWNSTECQKNKEILFNRYDLLMGTYYEAFRRWYPQHVHKYVHFPNFFFPYEEYAKLIPNLRPRMRCLMAASINRYYPFRMYIEKCRDKLIDITKVPFDGYPQLLNNYFCAIATVGSLKSEVHGFCEDASPSKYFEIPAAGVLMLGETVKELDVVGLKAGVHYIPITRKNVFKQIRMVLAHPEDYLEMRNKATKFVRENHSDINRTTQFKEILEAL